MLATKWLNLSSESKRTLLYLFLLCSFAFIIRVILPFSEVFGDTGVKFTSVDGYYHMRLIDNIVQNFPQMTAFDPYFSYPYGNGVGHILFFDYLIAAFCWIVGLGHPSQALINTAAAFYPAILGALTIIPVYFIGKKLFNPITGLFAAGLIAVYGGEFFGRSLLGFTDDHIMESLLSTTFMLFVIMAFQGSGKKRLLYIGIAGIIFGAYTLTWLGAFGFVAMLIVAFLVLLIIDKLKKKPLNLYLVAGVVIGMVTILIGIWINPYVFDALRAFMSGTSAATTMELQPLLSPQGVVTTAIAWANFSTSFFLLPSIPLPGLGIIALLYLIYKAFKNRGDNKLIVIFIIWSIVVLILTLMIRRFAYYLAINMALLSGYTLYLLTMWIMKFKAAPVIKAVAIIAVILFATYFNIGNQVKIASGKYFSPTDDWVKSLVWVKGNTPEPLSSDSDYYAVLEPDYKYPDDAYGIAAWWDYGYWITWIAHRIPIANPAQDKAAITSVAKMFLSETEASIPGANYIILDQYTSTSKLWGLVLWAGEDIKKYYSIYYAHDGEKYMPVRFFYPDYYQTLAIRLYNFNGEEVKARHEFVLWENRIIADRQIRVIVGHEIFSSEKEASAFINSIGKSNYEIAGSDPFISPIDIEAVESYTLVYDSEVKVFRYE